jgi:DNA-directed RNA polymerase II subunit RPB2
MSNETKFDWENKTWDVIDSHFKDKAVLIKHQIDSFNHFISNDIPLVLKEHNPIIVYGPNMQYHISFKQYYMSKPIINENDGSVSPMYPNIARLRSLTYASNLYIDIEQKIIKYGSDGKVTEQIQLETLEKFNIGKLPIMIGSDLCILNEQVGRTRAEMGECEYDYGGYFIINGSEKVIISQEKKCENKVYVFEPSKVLTKYSHTAEITSSVHDKPSIIEVIQLKLKDKDDVFSGKTIKFNWASRKLKQDIPLFILFRALGIISDKEIMEHILLDIYDENNKDLVELLKPSVEEAAPIQNQQMALEFISKYSYTNSYIKKVEIKPEEKLNNVYNLLIQRLFPHIGNSNIKKAFFLGYMTKKLLLKSSKVEPYDDRDSFINKRVETPGDLLKLIFKNKLNDMVKDLRRVLSNDFNGTKKIESPDIIGASLSKKIKAGTIEVGMKYALSTGTWGVKTQSDRKGVAQVLQRITYLGTISNLRRVVSPMTHRVSDVPRKLTNTQYGNICPCETPEGQPVGIVKNLALLSTITLYSNPDIVYSLLIDLKMNKLEDVRPIDIHNNCKVVLNGDWVGIHTSPNILVEELKKNKRSGVLNIYTSIAWYVEEYELIISTDGGRIVRPLYIVENNKLNITNEIADKLKEEYTWDDLLTAKIPDDKNKTSSIIEYIDAQEADTSMFALTQKTLDENKQDNEYYYHYTHCELHPSMMLGVLACNIPFANHNQAPRNLYQGAMGKQAIGIYTTTFRKRMDTDGLILHYPQRSLVNTRQSKYINGNILSAGTNAIVAIASYTGYNQEDSLIVNQSAIERDLFATSKFKTYKDEEKKNQSTLAEERFCKPEKLYQNGELKTEKMKFGSYENLDDNGIIKVGTRVSDNDIIIGKTIPLKNSEGPKFKDASKTIKAGTSGTIDKVVFNKTADGYNFCKVRVRSDRVPTIGDKFASQHGQKGTIGIVYKQQDMPFTKDGIVPDIIVNPHAIPSRMTVGHLIECITGKVATLQGVECDATPFCGVNVSDIGEILSTKCGFHSSGKEVMYNGKTGEQLNCDIFIGPTHYYRLKHLVDDKIHSRSTGPYQLLTRQPAEGRARDGGLRLGEMERDCLLAHGTTLFLKERFFDNSDKFLVYVCQDCGIIAIANPEENKYKCTYCKASRNFKQVQIPYASKLLIHELMSMCILPRLFTK